MHMG